MTPTFNFSFPFPKMTDGDQKIRMLVDSEFVLFPVYIGYRVLDFQNRNIHELTKTGWIISHSNKTCMRNIEVIILDEAITRFI